ncbi:MAG TPA: discoidin domain-containing protein, partial [Candidatus Nanoarchaeia archaeon]|nr:discoidin domain-containing protein [Candidatus Nanoarchaeia archaeon]
VSAAEGPDWAQIDLNDTYSISSIFINDGAYTDEVNREPCSFSVESSLDASAWETQFTLSDSGVSNWNDDAPTSINKSVDFDARYVRISNAVSGNCGGDEKGVRFGELIVYGDNVPVRSGLWQSIKKFFKSTLSSLNSTSGKWIILLVIVLLLVFFVHKFVLKKK